MMNCWTLPKTLTIGGKDYPIRYQFGAILDILAAYGDEDLDNEDKTEVMLTIFYPDFQEIPREDLPEAIEKACEFIDCGQSDEGKPKPRLMDWEKDASIIIPAINNVAGMEIRANPDLHWWTFWGYFMSIGDSLFSSVLHIRRKKKSGKKLEKWEQEFYQENQHLIDMRTHETEEIKAEKANILKYL
jgi:hypothetical protein